jgi:prepilin-type N-terminal cleavage/methylation domain-containing protein
MNNLGGIIVKRKKGFTLIELLAVIIVLGVILTIALPNIIYIISKARRDACEKQKDLIIDATRKYVLQNEKNIIWTSNVTTIYLSDLQNSNILSNPLKNPMGGNFNNTIGVTVTKNNNQYSYVINDSICQTDTYTDYIISQGINKPKIITGMTPIKWNGTTWVDTTESDTDWYNYTTADKKWANARTQDGSMWVWIPRYAYQTATNYHASTTGSINVKFLKDNICCLILSSPGQLTCFLPLLPCEWLTAGAAANSCC